MDTKHSVKSYEFIVGCCIGLLFALSSCRTASTPLAQSPSTLVEIHTKEDLLTTLDEAGIEVQEGGMAPQPLYGTEGQSFQVDSEFITVFEVENRESGNDISERLVSGDYVGAEWISHLSKPPRIWATGKLIVFYPGNEGGIILTLNALMGDPIVGIESSADEPFPPAIPAAIFWLSQSLDVEPSDILVLEFEPMEWPDSCLGLAELEEDCAQVIVSGWRIVLKRGGEEYVIRADEVGSSLRLEQDG